MTDINDAFAPLGEEEIETAYSPYREDESWRVLLPVPESAPQLPDTLVSRCAPEGYVVADRCGYRGHDGRLLGYTVRHEKPASGKKPDKQVLPFTFWEGPG